MREFHARGAVASEALVRALQRDNNGWAHAVLSQAFSVPEEYVEALLTGAATWEVKNQYILTIGLATDVSQSAPKQDELDGLMKSM